MMYDPNNAYPQYPPQAPNWSNLAPEGYGQYPAPSVPQDQPNQQSFISEQICKINAKDKVVDFSSRLITAKAEDFANVHGRGGKNHAPNSTIACTICDFTAGIGDKSVTVSYRIDVEDMELLYEAAVAARLGTLTANADAGLRTTCNAIRNTLRSWLTDVPPDQGGRLLLDNDIIAVGTAIGSALDAVPETVFSYQKEKNNPYKKDPQGNVPVSGINIAYCPYRKDGQKSRYPWVIKIDNYFAPLRERANGSTPHDSSKATGKKFAFIMVSEDDFLTSMVSVRRYVKLWEIAKIDLVRNGLQKVDQARQNSQAER